MHAIPHRFLKAAEPHIGQWLQMARDGYRTQGRGAITVNVEDLHDEDPDAKFVTQKAMRESPDLPEELDAYLRDYDPHQECVILLLVPDGVAVVRFEASGLSMN